MVGYLVAFEGLDQSGKETQAHLLRDRLKAGGRRARLVSFPDYGTSIGEEIARALQGEREYGADVMQLLFVANRYERKPDMDAALASGLVLLCDRYVASTIAYGEAQGLDPTWLADVQQFSARPISPSCSTSRRRRRCAGSLRIAITTNATSRCSSPYGKATCVRPRARLDRRRWRAREGRGCPGRG